MINACRTLRIDGSESDPYRKTGRLPNILFPNVLCKECGYDRPSNEIALSGGQRHIHVGQRTIQ
jgi:hypothetical protein